MRVLWSPSMSSCMYLANVNFLGHSSASRSVSFVKLSIYDIIVWTYDVLATLISLHATWFLLAATTTERNVLLRRSH